MRHSALTRTALAAAALGALGSAPLARAQDPQPFNLVEATVPQLRQAIDSGLLTSEQLVQMYLARIAAYDDGGPRLNSYLAPNDGALAEARRLDALRASPAQRGPLFGIPVLVKDNIDTADQPTTAGSVALAGSQPPDDAALVSKLRAAGAIILGKATLSEFANFITATLPNGYSSLGGFGRNPYDPRSQPDGRSVLDTGGSSSGSGIGVSANLAALAVGTETSGSILSPSSSNGVVGIKPTLGLVSRDGIIPITPQQDTAGPMARTVTDAAILLGVLAGADPRDPATAPCNTAGNCFSDYTQFLDRGALRGARIAVPPVPSGRAPIINAAITALRAQGAQVQMIGLNGPRTGICVTAPLPAGCSSVLLFDFKRALNAYLAATPDAPSRTLADVIAFNQRTPGALRFGQTIALAAQALDTRPGSPDERRFQADRAADIEQSRGPLDAVYAGPDGRRGTADDVDAILFSENFGADIAARAGYPSIVVPGGFLPGTTTPSGVTFSGPPFSEPRLIALAFAYEQATRNRRAPPSAPALPSDAVGRR
jgi:amidase